MDFPGFIAFVDEIGMARNMQVLPRNMSFGCPYVPISVANRIDCR
jgi:hypothetical protein